MTREVNRFCNLVLPGQIRSGNFDLEAVEMSVRNGMHRVGGVVLEKLINSDNGGHRGASQACDCGGNAQFIGYRTKAIISVVGDMKVNRAYYHCPACCKGIVPKDLQLDIVGTQLTPGVRRMMARVGGKESFDEGRRDLEELAGIIVTAKEVERISEEIGESIETDLRQTSLPDNVVPLAPISHLYVSMDGTGVPMVGRETEGRQGKSADGISRTREAKLGVVFTQTTLDKDGNPIRDEHSTTYVGAIETSEEFGKRIYAEVVRRGLSRAEQLAVLGDGAVWIWNEAEVQFPNAVMIVDFFHATEHLAALSKIMHESKIIADLWLDLQRVMLRHVDDGVEMVIEAMQRMEPHNEATKEELRRTINYFEVNRMRMRYKEFRDRGFFIGSGVIEAGCKTVIGQRLKQSGMRWTVKGANAIISLRCCQKSDQWDDYWENRRAA